jgi:hypothetical protein
MEYHFIYLLKEKQDVDSGEQIFKIGKSTQENTRRVKSYPSGSHLLLQVACIDCHSMESFLIQEFKNLFILSRGREYFKGDVFKMINLIFCVVQNEVNPNNVEYIITDNHNLSLCVHSKDDYINYSFNNKDNILDDYYRKLSSEKRKYTHLEIKYNNYKHSYTENMNELEATNTKLSLLSKSNKDYKRELQIHDKVYNELLTKYNDVILNNHNFEEMISNKDKIINELKDTNTKKLDDKDKLLTDVHIKYNRLRSENKSLLRDTCSLKEKDKLNNELICIKDENTKLILETNRIKTELITKHKEYSSYISTRCIKKRSYYILFGYIIYTMFHHLYMNPYSITNWLLLGGSCLIFRFRS